MEPYDEEHSGRPAGEQRYGDSGWGGLRPAEPEDKTRPHGLFSDVAH